MSGSVLRCAGSMGLIVGPEGETDPVGLYLSYYDPDALEGFGAAEWTDDVSKALRFDKASQAIEFWRQQSRARPFRHDGQPNRPLTAFSVEVVRLEGD